MKTSIFPLEEKYVCNNCKYPAINSSTFRELESPFREGPVCPRCGSMEIIAEKRYAYKWGWNIIHESGVAQKIQEIPGVLLQLSKIGDELPKGSMRREDLPNHVAQEFDEKTVAANKILKESGILEKLKDLGVNLSYHITVFDSKC